MKSFAGGFRILATTLLLALSAARAEAAVATIGAQTNGPTPFIKKVTLTVNPPAAFASVEFKVYPMPGSETRPVYVHFSKAYLQSLGLFNQVTGQVTLSVFGLYENYNNRVTLLTTFTDQTSQRDTIQMQTPVWTDATNFYKSPAIAKARTPNTSLSYDFILLRHFSGNNSPIIIDTDGRVRWIGTANTASQSAIYFGDSIYVYSGTSVVKMRLDGTVSAVVDLASQGVTGYHHNFELGRTGVLVQTDTSNASDPNLNQIESTIFEINGTGAILRRWNLSKTFRDAILEDATENDFVKNRGQTGEDWFHNNACTYRPSDNTLVVSSRENFVIAVDYDTGVLKWILGDTTKQWYVNYPSLRAYSLTADPSTVPMGQHAVHIRRDRLSCFNNGEPSYNHTPAGADRNFSMPCKYYLDTVAKTATLIWNYTPTPSSDSPICGSFYEDGSQSYVVDYATVTQLIGLDPTGGKAFDYRYTNSNSCATIYNAIPFHFENLRFN